MDRTLYKRVLTLALPAIVSTLLLSLQMIVDTIMLGRYPPEEVSLTALGLGSILFNMTFPLIMGLVIGSTAIIARRWGEEKYDEACKVASDSFSTMILISIPITFVIFFLGQYIITLLGARGDVITEGTKYIMAVFAFYPFQVFLVSYTGMNTAAGDTKTPMFVNIITNVYNIFMNYVLIFGNFGFPELGVLGAGLATGTSFVVGVVVYLLLQLRNKLIIHPIFKTNIKIRLETVKKMFKIGIPAGADMGMWAISSIFVTPLILYFGNDGYAAYQIGLRAESIAYMPGVGFGIAATTLAGQYLGAKKPELAKNAVLLSSKMVIIIMGLLGVILIIFPGFIARIFTADDKVIEIATLYLFLMGFSEPALGAILTLTGGMRGAGYTKVPLAINFIGLIVIRLSLLFILAFVLGMGLVGIWLGMIIEMFIRVFMMYGVFLKGSWMKVNV